MALSVQRLFERMSREFAIPATSENGRRDFIDALNDALSEMSHKARTTATRVSGLNQQINLDDDWNWIVVCGVGAHLSRMGYKSLNEEAKYDALWRDALSAAQMRKHIDDGTGGKW